MEINDELIMNYYFDDIIRIEGFGFGIILIYQKLYKNVLI